MFISKVDFNNLLIMWLCILVPYFKAFSTASLAMPWRPSPLFSRKKSTVHLHSSLSKVWLQPSVIKRSFLTNELICFKALELSWSNCVFISAIGEFWCTSSWKLSSHAVELRRHLRSICQHQRNHQHPKQPMIS